MLIRLLVVLLTLVGPMPFRVCTCAASVPGQTPADASTPATPVAGKTCRCGHNALPKGTAPAGDARAHAADCDGSHPNPHERDCPAANPAPAVRDAGTPHAPAAPTDCGAPHAAHWVESVPLAGAAPVGRIERSPPPKLPLFITLRTLRN